MYIRVYGFIIYVTIFKHQTSSWTQFFINGQIIFDITHIKVDCCTFCFFGGDFTGSPGFFLPCLLFCSITKRITTPCGSSSVLMNSVYSLSLVCLSTVLLYIHITGGIYFRNDLPAEPDAAVRIQSVSDTNWKTTLRLCFSMNNRDYQSQQWIWTDTDVIVCPLNEAVSLVLYCCFLGTT